MAKFTFRARGPLAFIVCNFVRDHFPGTRPPTFFQSADMHKDSGATARRRDESKASILSPFGNLSVKSHG
jgi:hypothetical protein